MDPTSYSSQAEANRLSGGLIPHPSVAPLSGGPFSSPNQAAHFGSTSSPSASGGGNGGLGVIVLIVLASAIPPLLPAYLLFKAVCDFLVMKVPPVAVFMLEALSVFPIVTFILVLFSKLSALSSVRLTMAYTVLCFGFLGFYLYNHPGDLDKQNYILISLYFVLMCIGVYVYNHIGRFLSTTARNILSSKYFLVKLTVISFSISFPFSAFIIVNHNRDMDDAFARNLDVHADPYYRDQQITNALAAGTFSSCKSLEKSIIYKVTPQYQQDAYKFKLGLAHTELQAAGRLFYSSVRPEAICYTKGLDYAYALYHIDTGYFIPTWSIDVDWNLPSPTTPPTADQLRLDGNKEKYVEAALHGDVKAECILAQTYDQESLEAKAAFWHKKAKADGDLNCGSSPPL